MLTLRILFSLNLLGGVVNVNGRKLCPRIILMTDGKPTNEKGNETPQVSTKTKQNLPVIFQSFTIWRNIAHGLRSWRFCWGGAIGGVG